MSTRQNLFKLFSFLAIVAVLFSNLPPISVSAQSGDGLKRQVNSESGKVSFISPESGASFAASQALGTSIRPQDPAMALAKRYAPEFGLQNPERDLAPMKNSASRDGRLTVRYQQKHQGIPVIGGELIVNTNKNGDLYSMNGEVSPNLSLSTQPRIEAEQARAAALQAVAKTYKKDPSDFVASDPELWIYDESLLQASTRPVELVWRTEVTAKDLSMPVRELVLVSARGGGISLSFNQIDTEWDTSPRQDDVPVTPTPDPVQPTNDMTQSQGEAGELQAENLGTYDGSAALLGSPLVNTYTANNGSSLPGTFLCNQTRQPCTSNNANPHADAAHKYAIGTYNLYASKHQRNSIDNSGMIIVSTVHFSFGYANAFWNGNQMVYGDAYGFPMADDVVAHELTHGVTQYESNLFYYYQSGAINESLSDLWGEYYDQVGNVTAGDTVRWLLGEDVTGLGALRSMSNPPDYGNPDKITSPYYDRTQMYDYYNWDNGGVHTNSGVNNKAVYLMVDGGTFNGRTVTALGWEKVGAIYYETNTNLLSSGADYSDLYYALQQACTNLIGQKGISVGDCVEVKDAVDAVEMNLQPAPNYNTDAPLCGAGQIMTPVFADDLENGTGNWTFTNGDSTRWQLDSAYYGQYAQSGQHSLYAFDQPEVVTDAQAQLAAFVIPSGAYLHFAQAYEFEYYSYSGSTFDGGVLEYSTNGGASWNDASPFMDYNGYTGTVATGWNNPLAGRPAFVGSSHGYISTRLNLSSLVGQTVTFRWRVGLDDIGSGMGWWIDNVKLYRCRSFISGNAGVVGTTLSYVDYTSNTAMSDGSGNYSILVPSGWSGTVTPSHPCYTFTPASRTYSNVTANQTAQNYVPAFNGNAACAMGAGTYDDTHAAWAYSGAWASLNTSGPHNSSLHYTFTTGDFALFPFTGRQFILTYTRDTNRANYDVYVDGNKVTTLNASGTFQWQRKYISPSYSNGTHVVEVRNAGGGGGVMDVDAIQILATAAPGVGIYDDGDAIWSYSGSWAALNTSGPYSNTLHYTFASGDAASFAFDGTQFILTYTRDTNRANYDVFVDGNKITQISANGTFQWQRTYTSPVFPSGTHIVEFRNVGGGGGVMDVDAIQILATTAPGVGTYDDTDAIWNYSGSWAVLNINGAHNDTLHYTFATGDSAWFTFNGTQFILTYTHDTNRANYDMYVDGNRIGRINANGVFQWQTTYASPVFPSGTHIVEFRNVGGGGGVMDVDAIQILATAVPGVGTYDDGHAAWSYSGSWSTLTTTGPYSDSLHYTFAAGDSAWFTFNGTQFILTYTRDTNRANYDVFVDGRQIARINATGVFQWRTTYTSSVFASGTHMVEFRNLGGGGGVMDVDAIEILATAAPGVGTYDDGHPNWSYSGSWAALNTSGPHSNSLHYTFNTGDAASFSFNGTQFILTYTRDTNRANYDVYVDGNRIARINANGTFEWQKTYTSPVSPAGTHIVEFRNVGGGGVMDVDAIQILATAAPGAGTYDDGDAVWSYSGSWAVLNTDGPYSNTLHYTFAAGDSAWFTFNGTQFILSYTQDTNRGLYIVYVDGSRVATINANGAFQWQTTYSSPVLASGTHMVEFQHVGGTGGVMDVDAITIN